jgi:hypothetical protein
MSISFTKGSSTFTLSLIDILRSDERNYKTSAQYINEAKSAIHQEVANSPRIEILDDNNNIIVVAYGKSWCELTFRHERGYVTLQLTRHATTNTQLSQNVIGNMDPTTLLRRLRESNPNTLASFFYAMGILDTLINHSMISHAQYNYWIGLFKPDED